MEALQDVLRENAGLRGLLRALHVDDEAQNRYISSASEKDRVAPPAVALDLPAGLECWENSHVGGSDSPDLTTVAQQSWNTHSWPASWLSLANNLPDFPATSLDDMCLAAGLRPSTESITNAASTLPDLQMQTRIPAPSEATTSRGGAVHHKSAHKSRA
ncbi:hypothetical protein LTS14_010688 [Recurvomyces mirabilis]|uniref:uncharacterized protein n=1 Tax=Recurvomyces mirabilis TaxID=574656 RepID=UPI002DE0739F|nr:hypothetical protein LTS14_010688 [Recurvomyces mirabilis]